MFDIDLTTSTTGFDIEMSASVEEDGRLFAKVAGVFTSFPVLVKISSVFVEKTLFVKKDDVFV